jgi:hypothetical protein
VDMQLCKVHCVDMQLCKVHCVDMQLCKVHCVDMHGRGKYAFILSIYDTFP